MIPESSERRHPRKRYREGFKCSVLDQLQSSGKSKAQVAQGIGIGLGNLRDGKRQYGVAAKPVDALIPPNPVRELCRVPHATRNGCYAWVRAEETARQAVRMSRGGCGCDNAAMEAFGSTLKREAIAPSAAWLKDRVRRELIEYFEPSPTRPFLVFDASSRLR